MPLPSRTTLAAAAAVGAVAFVFAFHQIYDPDFWFHLATGRWILEHGRVPTADPFSFATEGAEWVAHYWLPATGMALVWGKWGAAGIVIGKAAIVAAGFGLAVVLAARSGTHPLVAALCYAAAVPVAHFLFQERAYVWMYVFLPVSYWLFAAPGAERRPRTWIVAIPLMLVWVNVHASFLFAIGFAGLLATERTAAAAAAAVRREVVDVRGVALAGGLVLALCAVVVVNPYGLGLPRAVLIDYLLRQALLRAQDIEEYRAIVWSEHAGYAVLVAAAALSFVVAWRRPRPYALVACIVFAGLGARSVRFVGAASIVLAGVLAWNVHPAVQRVAARVRSPVRWLPGAVTFTALATLAVVAFRVEFVTGSEERFGIGVNESRFPGAAVRFLREAGFTGNLFNTWELGAYVTWHLPAVRVLVDGRALDAHIDLLDRLAHMDAAGMARWLVEHDVRGALLMRRDPATAFFAASDAYERAFFDDRAIVFLRKDVAARAPRATAYRFIRAEEFDPSYLVPIAQGPDAAAAERELRGAVAAAPDAFQPRFLLGVFLEARGNPEAVDHYVAAGRLSPGLALAHYDLGFRAGEFALKVGRAPEVEPLLRQSLQLQPRDPQLQAMLATSLYLQRKLPEAEALFQRALAAAPEYELALSNLGYLYVDTGRANLAVPLFERARRVAPGSEHVAYGLAYALDRAGERDRAARAWRDFLAQFPQSGWADRARARASRP